VAADELIALLLGTGTLILPYEKGNFVSDPGKPVAIGPIHKQNPWPEERFHPACSRYFRPAGRPHAAPAPAQTAQADAPPPRAINTANARKMKWQHTASSKRMMTL
jgi:hypothetical protein